MRPLREVTMATKQQGNRDDTNEMTALTSASVEGELAPDRVLISPWGRVDSKNGEFVVDEESARLAVEAFEVHGTDLPIDFEHQTLGGTYASPDGQAPAAGWIKRLYADDAKGLMAQIEWTKKAAELLVSKAYRYLSPVAIVRKVDRKLVAIHSAALTNKPAIVGMKPIINRDVAPWDSSLDESLAVLREELNLAADALPEVVLVAAGRRMAEVEREARQQRTAHRVRAAVDAGKLVAAQRDWAVKLLMRDEGLFDEWLATAPVVVIAGSMMAPRKENAAGAERQGVMSRARAEYRSAAWMAGLTDEEAYVQDALRQARR